MSVKGIEQTKQTCPDHPLKIAELVLTPEGRHYGKWVCSECRKYISWSKSPKASAEMIERRQWIREEIEYGRPSGKRLLILLNLYACKTLNLVDQERYINLRAEKVFIGTHKPSK